MSGPARDKGDVLQAPARQAGGSPRRVYSFQLRNRENWISRLVSYSPDHRGASIFADPRPNLTSLEELGLRTHRLAQAILGTQNKNAQASLAHSEHTR